MLKFGFGLVTGILLTATGAFAFETMRKQRSEFERFLEDDIDMQLEKLSTKLQEVKEQQKGLVAEQLAEAQG